MASAELRVDPGDRLSFGALYAMVPMTFVAMGVQALLCILGTIVFLESSKSARKGRSVYLMVSWAILILFTMSQVIDAMETFKFGLTFNHPRPFMPPPPLSPSSPDGPPPPRPPGGPPPPPPRCMSWVRIFGATCLWLCSWIGDGFLVYRCSLIWSDKKKVWMVPAIAYVGSCLTSAMAMAYRHMSNPHERGGHLSAQLLQAWICLSVAVNASVTGLISFRLLKMKRQLASVFSEGDLKLYAGIVAILVESAVPLTFTGIALASLSGRRLGSPEMYVARYVTFLVWFCLTALCPQLIIFRVATGKSWTISPTTYFTEDARDRTENRTSLASPANYSFTIPSMDDHTSRDMRSLSGRTNSIYYQRRNETQTGDIFSTSACS